MICYPLSPTEVKVVGWTARLMVVLALATIMLFGSLALASW